MNSKIIKHRIKYNNNKKIEEINLIFRLKNDILKNKNIEWNKDVKNEYNNYIIQEMNKWDQISINKNKIIDLINSLDSNNIIDIYYGTFFIEKLIYSDNDLIYYFNDFKIISILENYILNYNEPELQYLILKLIWYFIILNRYNVYYFIKNTNYLIKIIGLLTHNFIKIKKITMLIILYMIKDDKKNCEKILSLNIMNKIIDNIKTNINEEDLFTLYLEFILFINQKVILNINEKYELLKILNINFINEENSENILYIIKIIPVIIEKNNLVIFKNVHFFNKLYIIMKANINSEQYIKLSLEMIWKIAQIDDFGDLVIKLLQKLVIKILNINNKILNELIFKIFSYFSNYSRKNFLLILNIPYFYDYLVEIVYKKTNISWKEIIILFNNISNNLIIQDFNFISSKYIDIIIYFLKTNLNNYYVIDLCLNIIKKWLIIWNGNNSYLNQFIDYMIANGVKNILNNLKSVNDEDILNTLNYILDNFN